jgi:hypothetical protein
MGGDTIDLLGMETTGAFDSTGNYMTSVRIQMYADIRDPEYCALLPFMGGSCVACPNDGVVGCLEMDMRMNQAPYVPGVSSGFDPNATAADYPSECP